MPSNNNRLDLKKSSSLYAIAEVFTLIRVIQLSARVTPALTVRMLRYLQASSAERLASPAEQKIQQAEFLKELTLFVCGATAFFDVAAFVWTVAQYPQKLTPPAARTIAVAALALNGLTAYGLFRCSNHELLKADPELSEIRECLHKR